jgi:hypothetical protein
MARLITQDDLEFVGWWRFPTHSDAGYETAYAIGSMTLRIAPNLDRWVYALGTTGQLSRLMKMVPPPLTTLAPDPASAPFATHPDNPSDQHAKDLWLYWHYKPEWFPGMRANGDIRVNNDDPTSGSLPQTFGVLWEEAAGLLHGTGEPWYDTTGSIHQTYWHAQMAAQDNPTVSGPWRFPEATQYRARGQMVLLPGDFPINPSGIAIGSGGLTSGADGCSYGPGLWAPTNGPITGDPGITETIGDAHVTALLDFYGPLTVSRFCPRDTNYFVRAYECDNTLPRVGPWKNPDYGAPIDPCHSPLPDATHGYWSPMDLSMAATWIQTPNLYGVLFGTAMAQGTITYIPGSGTRCDQGHKFYFYVFNPSDLVDVANLRKQAWEPEPTYWEITKRDGTPVMPIRLDDDGHDFSRLHGMFTEVCQVCGQTYLHVLDAGAVVDGSAPPYPAVAVFKLLGA